MGTQVIDTIVGGAIQDPLTVLEHIISLITRIVDAIMRLFPQ